MSQDLKIKIGADPEYFLKDSKGKVKSAEGLIGGTKETPLSISKFGHAIQEDNVMVEFNIPPAETKKQFVKDLNFVLDYVDDKVKPLGLSRNIISSAVISQEEGMTEQALLYGCEPDFNVYKEESNPRITQMGLDRTAGGHVHVGYSGVQIDVAASQYIVKAMDAVLGVFALENDKDTFRRKFYGKAGSFRFKPYGVEYRTLSNFWLKSDKLMGCIYDLTIKAVKASFNPQFRDYLDEIARNGKIENIVNGEEDNEFIIEHKENLEFFNIKIQ